MVSPPKIENAPGLKWRKRRTGWSAFWQARHDLVKRGFEPAQVNLLFWTGGEIDRGQTALIQTECEQLQANMLTWGRVGGEMIPPMAFDGTVKGLWTHYVSDDLSDFHGCRWATRQHYQSLFNVIGKTAWKADDGISYTVGDTPIAAINARAIKTWHRIWSHNLEKIPMGHACVTMLRTIIGHGVANLEDDECVRVSVILSKLSFPMGGSRNSAITSEQINMIREAAHAAGYPSIALAQAIQFEFTWRQKDVIGEWVPGGEKGVTDVHDGNEKWLRGLRWSEVDANMIVSHTTSKRQKISEPDIRHAPMVLEELQRIYGTTERAFLPKDGPVIVCEFTGLPWTAQKFRNVWRELADSCGIPKTVRNMDTRAGAITEAVDLGADLEKVRKTATHSQLSMTAKYSRGDQKATADVMQIRALKRVNKPGLKAENE